MPFPWKANEVLTGADLNAEFQTLINAIAALPTLAQISAPMAMSYNKASGVLTITKPDGTLMAASVPGSPTTATSFSLFNPGTILPSTSITLNGTFTGVPLSVDVSVNAGSTWTTWPSGQTTINTSTGTLALSGLPTFAAGTYANGTIKVRDSNATTVIGNVGKFQSMAFNPATPTSGTLVFQTKIADPAFAPRDSNGIPQRLNNVVGNGMFLTYGPTTPRGTLSGTYVCTTPNSPALSHASGADSTQNMLLMQTTSNAGIFDIAANFYDAGPLGGPNDALIQLFDTSNLSTNGPSGGQVVIFGFYGQVGSGGYGGGPIWGKWNTGNTVSYITAGRVNGGTYTPQINDQNPTSGSGHGGFWQNTANVLTLGNYYVGVFQKNGATCTATVYNSSTGGIAYGPFTMSVGSTQSGSTGSTGATAAFNATNFSLGGSIAPGPPTPSTGPNAVQSGNAYGRFGDMMIFSGVPSAGDILNGAKLVAAQLGL